MSRMAGSYFVKLGLGLCGLVWAAGCSTQAQVGEYPNQQHVAGQSRAAILACAGTPKKEIRDGELTLLRYYREAPILEESHPVGKSSMSTIHHGCWATIILREDRVVDVRYRFVPPTFDASNDCEEILEPCLQ